MAICSVAVRSQILKCGRVTFDKKLKNFIFKRSQRDNEKVERCVYVFPR